jgi:hypothetical protein
MVPVKTDAFVELPLEGATTPRGCTVQLPLREQERIYGLGLQFLSFEQRERRRWCEWTPIPSKTQETLMHQSLSM